MKKAYYFDYSPKILPMRHQVYEEMMTFLRFKNPEAKCLEEDQEISQIYSLLFLIRQGRLQVKHLDLNPDAMILLEIFEDN